MKKSSIYAPPLIVLLALLVLISATFAKWIVNGIAVSASAGDERSPAVATDGRRGAIIAWRNGGVIVQRVNAFGNLLWDPEGVVLCHGNTKEHTLIANGAGGAAVAWSYRRGADFDVYLQRLSQSGVPFWGGNGLAICSADGDQESPRITADGAGNFIVAWRDGRGADGDIYAQKITEAGDTLWAGAGLAVCTEPGDQEPVGILPDGSGGAFIAWVDSRGLDLDIYAQRIDAAGARLWPASGIAICTEAGDQELPQIVPDHAGGVIAAWQDTRGSDSDIYVQRIDGSGTPLWDDGGVAACPAAGDQTDLALAPDGAGGAIITWCDRRNSDADIYAQRVSAIGAAFWDPAGVPLCASPEDQSLPMITADGAGGAIATWHDLRGLDADIYAQRVARDGRVIWEQDGVIVCNAPGEQSSCRIASDGFAGAIMAWVDARASSLDIYAQRIDSRGSPVLILLEGYKAYRKDINIFVTWTMARDDGSLHFFVLRAPSQIGPFRPFFIPLERKGQNYSFVDDTCEPGCGYTYRVEILTGNARELLFETPPILIPSRERSRSYNSPNPFNPATTISYTLDVRAHVRLEIYDVAGRRIASLVDAVQQEGNHRAVWNGKDNNGVAVASGIYFYRLSAGDITESRKMILLR